MIGHDGAIEKKALNKPIEQCISKIVSETKVRVHPFYDVIKKFSKESDNWSVDAWVVALCRFKGRVKVHSMSSQVKSVNKVF